MKHESERAAQFGIDLARRYARIVGVDVQRYPVLYVDWIELAALLGLAYEAGREGLKHFP